MVVKNSNKSLNESAEKKNVSEYIHALEMNIRDEIEAIDSYNNFLKMNNLPADARAVITEIKEDELDHLTMLSLLLEKQTVKDFGSPDEFTELTGEKVDTLVKEEKEDEEK